MFKKLVSCVVILLTIAATYVLWRGTPSVAAPEIAQNIIEANKPALVTITVRIQDPHSMFLALIWSASTHMPQ